MKDHVAPILEELRKSKEELETLRAENAKLIAERDESNKVFGASDRKLLDRLLAERDEAQSDNESLEDKLQEQMNLVGSLLVEREQWMKQEPDYYGYDGRYYGDKTTAEIFEGKQVFQELFDRPLPAQQVPEDLEKVLEVLRSARKQGWQGAWEAEQTIKVMLSVAPKPEDKS